MIKAIFSKIVPDFEFNTHFLDEDIDALYRSERRTGKIINGLTMVTLFTACLGLFGLAAFAAQTRTKEIGIRKVLGASTVNITILLSKEFVRFVFIANLIAWPLGYFVMRKWLEGYTYRIDFGLSIFIFSGFAILMLALLTVSFQSVRAAKANPVHSLKDE